MPLFGSNRVCITWVRVDELSAPLLVISQAAVSVNDAPAPVNCWDRVFSLTVRFCAPLPPFPKAIGGCCCSPRVTWRPPESSVVVSQMLTLSPAACAGDAAPVRREATRARKAEVTSSRAGRRPARRSFLDIGGLGSRCRGRRSRMPVGGRRGTRWRPPAVVAPPAAEAERGSRADLTPPRRPPAHPPEVRRGEEGHVAGVRAGGPVRARR